MGENEIGLVCGASPRVGTPYRVSEATSSVAETTVGGQEAR